MKNLSKIRKSIVCPLLVLCLAVGTLTPLTTWAWDGQDPQEGGSTRAGSRVTCTSTTYNIIIAIIVVTECSDGTRTVSIT